MGRGIDTLGSPIGDKVVQPNGAHAALIERDIARKTAALAYRQAGGRYNYIWPSPDEAPYAEITALATWTSFQIGAGGAWDDVTYGVPWFHCHQYDSIKAFVFLGVRSSSLSLEIRIISDDLVDVVAATNGTPGRITHLMNAGLMDQDSDWNRSVVTASASGAQLMRYLCGVSSVQSPTLPATRRVQIFPQIQCTNPTSSHIDNGGTYRMFLKQMMLLDVPEPEIGG